jgi:hypothetical protein
MPIDNLPHARFVDTPNRGEQADGAIQILRVFADDRDGEGVPVRDQHPVVAIEQNAARRTQRERALVVVLSHLLELRMLDDLDEPEAQRQHGKDDDGGQLHHRQPDADSSSIFWNSHLRPALHPASYPAPLGHSRKGLDDRECNHPGHGIQERLGQHRLVRR